MNPTYIRSRDRTESEEKKMSDPKEKGKAAREESRDETTAMIYGYDHPAARPVGRCWRCGGEVWPVEDACWDGAQIHYITFAYQCYQCGLQDVWDFSVKESKNQ